MSLLHRIGSWLDVFTASAVRQYAETRATLLRASGLVGCPDCNPNGDPLASGGRVYCARCEGHWFLHVPNTPTCNACGGTHGPGTPDSPTSSTAPEATPEPVTPSVPCEACNRMGFYYERLHDEEPDDGAIVIEGFGRLRKHECIWCHGTGSVS